MKIDTDACVKVKMTIMTKKKTNVTKMKNSKGLPWKGVKFDKTSIHGRKEN